jgi:hypothetical protein
MNIAQIRATQQTKILQRPLLPGTGKNWICSYHPNTPAAIVIGAHELSSSETVYRPLCPQCFEEVRNLFAVLGDGLRQGKKEAA